MGFSSQLGVLFPHKAVTCTPGSIQPASHSVHACPWSRPAKSAGMFLRAFLTAFLAAHFGWPELQVVYSKFGFMYTDIKMAGEDYILVREDDVIGIMPHQSKC